MNRVIWFKNHLNLTLFDKLTLDKKNTTLRNIFVHSQCSITFLNLLNNTK
jgi:hypothetical protein